MREIKIEQVGEILQNIYDSEIDLHIGYCWDGGYDYSLDNTPYPILGVDKTSIKSTGKDKINEALEIIVEDILEKYPSSKFSKLYSNLLTNINNIGEK